MDTILAISSSPRRQGNSELLLESFNQGVKEEKFSPVLIRINDLDIRTCQACDHCAGDGECILQDDMQEIYPQVASARGLVIATPIYFGSMSAQLKMFIDRFQGWWHAKYNLESPQVKREEGRPGFFICVGALQKKAYAESALAVARIFFHNVNYVYNDYLCYRGIDEKGAIKEQSDALQNAFEAGRRIAVEAGKH